VRLSLEGHDDDRIRALRERVRRNDARAWLARFWRAAFEEELPMGPGVGEVHGDLQPARALH
jgi:hypothetical protein